MACSGRGGSRGRGGVTGDTGGSVCSVREVGVVFSKSPRNGERPSGADSDPGRDHRHPLHSSLVRAVLGACKLRRVASKAQRKRKAEEAQRGLYPDQEYRNRRFDGKRNT